MDSSLVGLIGLGLFIILGVCVDLSGFLRSKTDTERGKPENIDCQKMREFKRIYNRCKRKWFKDKNLVLYKEFQTLDNYVKTEFALLYDWEQLFYECEYK